MIAPTYLIPSLPPPGSLETPEILRTLNQASRALGELKGEAKTIPNQQILINTLFLQEALASSKIENIVTTQDELFQVELFPGNPGGSPAAKEVARYRDALMIGYNALRQKDGVISNNLLVELFRCLKQLDGDFRRTPGTLLRNEGTGENVYVPPQAYDDIVTHMSALERFINDDGVSTLDPLIKMAIIHHQFESVHPFPDGNGRIGRMLNVLYLTRAGLLDSPILYLSREINKSKDDYYRLLQAVRDDGAWEEWVLYMLRAVHQTAVQTTGLVRDIRKLMADFKTRMRSDLPKIYSQDLLNNLFRHPYTRIEYVMNELGVVRLTATTHLNKLADAGLVTKIKKGRNNYYINDALVSLFLEVSNDN